MEARGEMKQEAPRLNGGTHTDDSAELLTERILVPCSPTLLQRIQDYRFANRYNSQSAAVRKLLELGLEAEKKKRPNTLI